MYACMNVHDRELECSYVPLTKTTEKTESTDHTQKFNHYFTLKTFEVFHICLSIAICQTL